MQQQRQAKQKDCGTKDCKYDQKVVIPNAQCNISDCGTIRSLNLKVKQDNAFGKDCDRKVKQKPIRLLIEADQPKVKCPHFRADVDVDLKFEPGCVEVQGGDVHVGPQEIFVEFIRPKDCHHKPTWEVHCNNKCPKTVEAPKVHVTPGKVKVACPIVHVKEIERCRKKPRKCPKEKCDKQRRH